MLIVGGEGSRQNMDLGSVAPCLQCFQKSKVCNLRLPGMTMVTMWRGENRLWENGDGNTPSQQIDVIFVAPSQKVAIIEPLIHVLQAALLSLLFLYLELSWVVIAN